MEAVVSPPLGITGRVEDPYGDTLGGRSRDPKPTFLAGGAWVPEYSPASSALDVGEPQPLGLQIRSQGGSPLGGGGVPLLRRLAGGSHCVMLGSGGGSSLRCRLLSR
jgi:hypothetical protein